VGRSDQLVQSADQIGGDLAAVKGQGVQQERFLRAVEFVRPTKTAC